MNHSFVDPGLLGDEFHIFRREETFRSSREHGLPEENIIGLREPWHFATFSFPDSCFIWKLVLLRDEQPGLGKSLRIRVNSKDQASENLNRNREIPTESDGANAVCPSQSAVCPRFVRGLSKFVRVRRRATKSTFFDLVSCRPNVRMSLLVCFASV